MSSSFFFDTTVSAAVLALSLSSGLNSRFNRSIDLTTDGSGVRGNDCQANFGTSAGIFPFKKRQGKIVEQKQWPVSNK